MGFLYLLEMSIDFFGHDHLGLTLLLVKDGVIQGFTLVKDGDLALGVLAHSDLGFAQGISRASGLYLVDHLVVLQGEVLRKDTCLLAREDDIEFIFGKQQGEMGIMIASGLDSKTTIEIFDVLGSKIIGGLDRVDAPQAQFLDQPILKRQVDPLHASFGLRGVSADDLDV